MSLFNGILSMGSQPYGRDAHSAYLKANNLNDSYRSPYSTLGRSVFDKNPGPVNKISGYAPYGPIQNVLGPNGWANSKAREDFTNNPYGHRREEDGGNVNLGLYALSKGWDVSKPEDWKKLWNDVNQYRSGHNPGGKTGSPFPIDVGIWGTGGIHGMVANMPRDMALAYRKSRYGGYDNGMRSPIGAASSARSVDTGIRQNPEWDEVTGGRTYDYYG